MNQKVANQIFLKRQLHYFVYTFCLLFFFALVMNANAQTQKPNIILILGDDVGYKSLSCNGGNLYSTPNIDTLAQNGMRFTQCHAAPLCSPSRFMLLTGKYNFRNYTEWGVMDTGQRTIGNIFKDAGYKTAFYGKSQLGGGSKSIRTFGFDKYAISSSIGPKYKNPSIYCNSGFLPDNLTNGKYSEDIFTDSLLSFIDKNKKTPFFIYYSMVSVHSPFGPTPDDAAFAGWDPTKNDTSFYSSMIKYMDKKIGMIIQKVKSLGIENNTLILFLGDNGTSALVKDYVDDDTAIYGNKKQTTEAGIHVPLIAYWPNVITEGSINDNLIDFTDFIPTLANIANITVPESFGIMDGVSFASQLTSSQAIPRDWIFCHFDPRPGQTMLNRWAQTIAYKLYDTSSTSNVRLFYNIINDPKEKIPIPDNLLTPEEITIKQQLLDVINGYVAQGTPLISLNPSLSLITGSSVVLNDTIKSNGGSTVTASGAVWSTSSNPEVSSSSHTSSGVALGFFSTSIEGLTANTTYYVRAYATNFAGTVYSNQMIFKTLGAVVATDATLIDSVKFTANWNDYAGATAYRLDVSTSPSFIKTSPSTISQSFINGITPPIGWTISNNIIANTNSFGNASPSLELIASKAQVITKRLSGPATQLSFWLKGLNTNQVSALLVEGFDGNNWKVITNITKLPKGGAKKTFNATSVTPLEQNFVQFRFTYTKKAGTLALDDVVIKYNNITPLFIPGCNNLLINTNSKIVTGLKAATNYYYRVRAVTGSSTTFSSNVITASTCKAASIINIDKINLNCAGSNDGSITLNVTGGVTPLAYNWTGPYNFISTNKNINNLAAGTYHLKITSNGGCAVDTNISLIEPQVLTATTSTGIINCNGGTTTLSVSPQGGTGNYHYTISDGTNTTGPQDDNHFTVVAGNYIVTVEDDNHCSFTTSSVQVNEPPALNASLNADAIVCSGGTTILTVNATGGTGNYHYTISDGANTTGPQDDNHFTVASGNYTVTVEDDNHCSFTTSSVQVDEPPALNASINADAIVCSGGTTILTVNTTGGTGNYHYTLSDGTNTTGPQDDDNYFTVTAGSYTVTVTDDNGCSFTIDAIQIDDGTEVCDPLALNKNKSNTDNIKSITQNNDLNIHVFPNPSANEFTLTFQSSSNEKVEMIVADVYGKKVYQASGSIKSKYSFGKEFISGIYFIRVIQGNNFKTLRLIKEK